MIDTIKTHFQTLKDSDTYKFEEYSETHYASLRVGVKGIPGWDYWFEYYAPDKLYLYGKPFDIKEIL
jgi:hypothetical protein